MSVHPSTPLGREDVAVGYDASLESHTAIRWAATEAEVSGRRLAVVTVVDPARYGLTPHRPALRRFLLSEAHRTADREIARVREAHPGLDVRLVARAGTPFVEVGQVAGAVSLLVLGVRHRSVASRLLFGSVAQEVLRHGTTPVVLVPHRSATAAASPNPHPHVVAVIGPAAGGGAVDFALAEARARHLPVTVIRARRGATGVVAPGEAEDERVFGAGIGAALERARRDTPDLHVDLRGADTTVSGLLDLGLTDDDLLVIGNHEPGEGRLLLTDRAVAAVLHHPHLPVAVVPDTTDDQAPAATTAPTTTGRAGAAAVT